MLEHEDEISQLKNVLAKAKADAAQKIAGWWYFMTNVISGQSSGITYCRKQSPRDNEV